MPNFHHKIRDLRLIKKRRTWPVDQKTGPLSARVNNISDDKRLDGLSSHAIAQPTISINKQPIASEEAIKINQKPALPMSPAPTINTINDNNSPTAPSQSAKSQFWQETLPDYLYEKRQEINSLVWTFSQKRLYATLMVGVALAFIVSCYFLLSAYGGSKDKVYASVQSGQQNLNDAEEDLLAFKIDSAISKIKLANQQFLQARQTMAELGQQNAMISDVTALNSNLLVSETLLDAATDISNTGLEFNNFISQMASSPSNFSATTSQLSQKIDQSTKQIHEANQKLKNAKVQPLSDTENERNQAVAKLDQLETSLGDLKNLLAITPKILGQNGTKRYLLFFQNPREMRASGGFWGDYGELELKNGQITNLKIDNIYALSWLKDNQYNEAAEDAVGLPSFPAKFAETEETRVGGHAWHMQEANWSIDFSRDAERATWLYENSYHQNHVDGVIAIDPYLFIDLMKIVGPINMPQYQTQLSADNFWDTIENKVEIDNAYKITGNKSLNPKQILVDFAPLFTQKLGQADLSTKSQIMGTVFKDLVQKHIVFYDSDPSVQAQLRKYGVSGEIKSASGDFLAMYNTNIAPTKSSVLDQKSISQSVSIDQYGKITDSVKVEMQNQAPTVFPYGQEDCLLQLVAPKGSVVVASYLDDQNQSFPVYSSENNDKTVFSTQGIVVNPTEKHDYYLIYKLPDIMELSNTPTYSLQLQKQPGVLSLPSKITIKYPKNWQIENQNITPTKSSAGRLDYDLELSADKLLNIKFIR